MFFGAFPHFLGANQTFPRQIAATVEGQLVGFDHLVDERINVLIDLLNAGAFRETSGNGETHFLEFFDVHLFTQTTATILCHYFTLSNIKSHTP
ncbi:Uncharacterised protein [Enterobacter hormaechei]|nr:Uncharacterised protein [Enterobacter hormaechei]